MIGIASRNAYDKPVYSLSVLLRAISVWSCDRQVIGHLAYVITYPCHDLAVSGSEDASFESQFPAKSASTYTSIPLLGDGRMIVPLSRVPLRYLPSHLMALPCSTFGSVVNRAHWCTMYTMSPLEPLSR